MVELGELEAHRDEFASRHTRIVVVSVDNQEDSQKTKDAFPSLVVVADSEHKLVSAAEVLHPHAGEHGEDVAAPTTIFIDKQGMVRSLYRPKQIISRLSAKEVLEMVDKNLTGGN
jgi:peroxiredoxin